MTDNRNRTVADIRHYFAKSNGNLGELDVTVPAGANGYIQATCQDGEVTEPLREGNLIGNGPKVLETVDMVADDMELYSGAGYCGKDGQRMPVGFGLPTIRCGAMSIGGRKS